MSEEVRDLEGNEDQLRINVETIKSRIIATHKLFKYLKTAKQDVEDKNSVIETLQKKLESIWELTEARDKENSQLEEKFNGLKNDLNNNLKEYNNKTQSLEQEIARLLKEKATTESIFHSRDLYVKQLEAQCESFKNGSNSNDNSQKQSAEIKRLQQEIKKKDQEFQKLKGQMEEEDDAKEKAEYDLLTLQIDHDLLNTQHEEVRAELKGYKEKYALIEQESKNLASSYASVTQENKKLVSSHASITQENKRLVSLNSTLEAKLTATEKRLVDIQDQATKSTADETQSRSSPQIDNSAECKKMKQQLRLVQSELKFAKYENECLHQQVKALFIQQENADHSGSDEETRDHSDKTKSPTCPPRLLTQATLEPMHRQNQQITPTSASHINKHTPSTYIPTSSYTQHSIAQQEKKNHSPSGPNTQSSSAAPPSRTPQKEAKYNTYAQLIPEASDAQGTVVSPPTTPPVPLRKEILRDTNASILEASNAQRRGLVSPATTLPSTPLKEIQRDLNPRQNPEIPLLKSLAAPHSSSSNGPIEKSMYRVSGLVPPPSVVPVRAPPKSKAHSSRLEKFVNSRNPAKFLDSSSTVAKKRTIQAVEMPKPAAVKKVKQEFKYLKIAENFVDTLYAVPKHVNLATELEPILSEMEICFEKIRSASNPSSSSDASFGKICGVGISVPDILDKREKLYAWLLWSLIHEDPKMYETTLKSLFSIINERIKAARPQSTLMRYIRTASILCKEASDLERMRTLCFDVIRYSKCAVNTMTCLLNIACIYGDSLKIIYGDQRVGAHLMQKSICSAVHHIASSFVGATQKNMNEIHLKIVSLCEWPQPKDTPSIYSTVNYVTDIMKSNRFKELHDKNKDEFTKIKFCIVKGLELLFSTINSWVEVYDNYIRKVIWPLLSHEKIDNICLELLATLGALGLADKPDGKDKLGVAVLLEKLVGLLKIELGDDMKYLQYTSAYGVMLLSKTKPEFMAVAESWLRSN